MMISVINTWLVILAVFCVLFFIVIYSSTRWEESEEGINIMLFPVGFLLLAFSSISKRADLLSHPYEDLLSMSAWILVSGLMIQRGIFVIKAQRRARKEAINETGKALKEIENNNPKEDGDG